MDAALREREVEQVLTVDVQNVESDEGARKHQAGEEVDLLAAETLLELSKRNGAAIAPTDDFAVQDKIAGDAASRGNQLGKFGDAIESAGEELNLRAALVELRANAIELVLHQSPRRKRGDQIFGRFARAGQHRRDGAKHLEGDGRQRGVYGSLQSFADVAGKHVGALHQR